MDIFGIGLGELLLIFILAIVVLGPDGMKKAARSLAKTIRSLTKSPLWNELLDTRREMSDLPGKLIKEAGIEDDVAEIRAATQELKTIQNPGKDAYNKYQSYVSELNAELNTIQKPQPESPSPEPKKPPEPPSEPKASEHSDLDANPNT